MKTNWTGPGAGATVGELINELGFRPLWTQKVLMSQRTNLALTSTGEVEEYDRRRFENAEVLHLHTEYCRANFFYRQPVNGQS